MLHLRLTEWQFWYKDKGLDSLLAGELANYLNGSFPYATTRPLKAKQAFRFAGMYPYVREAD